MKLSAFVGLSAGQVFEGGVLDVGAPLAAPGNTPVVFVHGMGDAGSNPGMKNLCASVPKKFPGTYSKCSNVANGLASITQTMDKQLEEFVADIRSDGNLTEGFNVVGLSQGNLLVRAYIERYNNPPVKKFISMCGPHNGVATCPDNLLYKLVCPLWKINPYGASIAFSDYWKDPTDQDKYLKKNRWLADINNERETKNSTYKAHMASLDKYILVEALQDIMVVPHASESHGFYSWGQEKNITALRDTEAYKGDWLGLQTLDKAGKLATYTYEGDHLRWSAEFYAQKILPELGPAGAVLV